MKSSISKVWSCRFTQNFLSESGSLAILTWFCHLRDGCNVEYADERSLNWSLYSLFSTS